MSERSYHGTTSCSCDKWILVLQATWVWVWVDVVDDVVWDADDGVVVSQHRHVHPLGVELHVPRLHVLAVKQADKLAAKLHLLLEQCQQNLENDNIHRWRKEGNVLFNNALNTFYLQLYGVRHMVKDHSDSEKGNLLPPHRLLILINSKGSFICTIPHRIAHTMTFVTPVVEHWLERDP